MKGRTSVAKCRGFGNYGNPLAGFVRICSDCSGIGQKEKPKEPEKIRIKPWQIVLLFIFAALFVIFFC